MTLIFLPFFLMAVCVPINSIFFKTLPEDGRLNFTELGAKYGHPVEEHEVFAEDGYILTIFRIRGKRKTPVLLMHGIADTADTFIIRGKTSLVIALADAGYDVWAGNMRGNKYCQRHRKLNPEKDSEFWDFSFHEIGYYDLPAIIDYVIETTGEQKLQGIGHSQGTTVQYVLLSKRPEYNAKIKILISLAPAAFFGDLKPPVSTIAKFGPALDELFKSLKIEHTFPENSPITTLLRLFCSQDVLSYEICFLWTGWHLVGFDTKRVEPSFTKIIIGHYPGATSRKNFIHVDQLVLSKRFCEYDYGPDANLKRYGYLVPPDYNVRTITAKVAIFVGENDALARSKDAEIQRTLFPNVVYYHKMEDKEWNHIDFTWGNDMNVTLFPLIFQLLEKYD